MANFLNNKYGYANFVGLMMILFAGFFYMLKKNIVDDKCL